MIHKVVGGIVARNRLLWRHYGYQCRHTRCISYNVGQRHRRPLFGALPLYCEDCGHSWDLPGHLENNFQPTRKRSREDDDSDSLKAVKDTAEQVRHPDDSDDDSDDKHAYKRSRKHNQSEEGEEDDSDDDDSDDDDSDDSLLETPGE